MTRFAAALFTVTAVFAQAPDAARQTATLDNIRAKTGQYLQSLPNFLCLQTTTQQQQEASARNEQWKLVQTIDEQINFFDQKETYQVLRINGKPAPNTRHEKLKHLTSSGEFGRILMSIFLPKSQTEFHWDHDDTFNGHRVNVFYYEIAQPNSTATIRSNDVSAVVGYHGFLSADVETGAVLHYTKVDEPPIRFPVQAASSETTYDFVEISGQKYLLPVKSDTHLQIGNTIIRNLIQFTRYSKFDAQTTITFDTAKQ